MSKTLCLSLMISLSIGLAPGPAMAQYKAYENLAYVPRQGEINMVLTGLGQQLGAIPDPSVNDLATAYKLALGQICSGNPEGEIVNWFGKVHAVETIGDQLRVELIIAERASALAVMPVNSEAASILQASAGRWVRFDGGFIPDSSCLLQVPPLTLAAVLQPQYLAKITSVRDNVADTEVEQLETALPNEVWAPARQD